MDLEPNSKCGATPDELAGSCGRRDRGNEVLTLMVEPKQCFDAGKRRMPPAQERIDEDRQTPGQIALCVPRIGVPLRSDLGAHRVEV